MRHFSKQIYGSRYLCRNPNFLPYVLKADLLQSIMLGLESLVGLPMHTFRLAAAAIQDASLLTQPFANLVSFARCLITNAYFLRGVTQPSTLPSGKVPARRVEHRHPFAVLGAGKPVLVPLAAQVAR
jgi:hypothetical protein